MTTLRELSLVSTLLYLGYINCISAICPDCLDLVLIVDRSSSVGSQDFDDHIRPFLRQFGANSLWSLGAGDDDYQVAVVTYGSDATLEWQLGSIHAQSTGLYIAGVDSIPVPQFALTNPGSGMVMATEGVLGHHDNRPGCSDVCIVLVHDEMTKGTALFHSYLPTFHAACHRVIAVGVAAERWILEALASDLMHIVDLPGYDQLAPSFPQVAQLICQPEPTTQPPTTAEPTTTPQRTTEEPTTEEPTNGGYDCPHNSPCRPLVTPGLYYYPHVLETKFVQCDAWGGCYNMPCALGTVWRQELLTCDHAWKYQ